MSARPTVVLQRKRKKGKYWLFATSALLMSTALAARPATAAQNSGPQAVRRSEIIAFSIPAGPLDAVLKQFEAATATSVQLKVPADTAAMMTSPGASGSFTIEDGLQGCSKARH
jgi:hypothetical protein